MVVHRKCQSHDITEYALIAKALSTSRSQVKIKNKFDITYLICEEQLAFTKMATLCKLEEKHGVDMHGVGL